MIILVKQEEGKAADGCFSFLLFVVNLIGTLIFEWKGVLIELTNSVKKFFQETASQLKGAARRRFQAEVVMELGCTLGKQ